MGDETANEPVEPAERDEPEITDLRTRAHPPAGWRLWSARGLAGEQLTARQRLWRGGSATLAVLLALLVIFASVRAAALPMLSGTTTDASGRLAVSSPHAQVDGLTCEVDAAWSPDSSRYAVLGYGGGCDVGHGDPGVVNLYRPPRTLVARLAPAGAILQAASKVPLPLDITKPGTVGAGTGDTPLLFYGSILWSPDGRQLAVTFTLVLSYEPYAGYSGVYLTPVAGGQPTVLLAPDLPTSGASYLEWDIERGQPRTQLAYASSSPYFAINVPVASLYQWTADGRLVPADAGASQTSVAPSPVGLPGGTSLFTPWQPGHIMLVTKSPNGTTYPGGAYDWQTGFPAWSPDGRYLLDTVAVAGRLEPPGRPKPSAATLAGLQMDTLAVLPVRDAGLRQALLSLSTTSAAKESLSLAWRPDGQALAATTGGDVTLYDCTTGQSQTLVVPLPAGHSIGGVEDLLRWSPDGRWLLLSDLRVLRLG